jgi:hypothetical protein
MRISKELQDQRNALRSNTQRKAHAIMQEVEKARQQAAKLGDKETAFWLQDQITELGNASTLADFDAVNNFELAWNKRKQEQLSDAEKQLEARKPIADPKAILDKARRIKANGKLELDRIERERINNLK